MVFAVAVLVYLVGVPFGFGVLGEKCGRGDWAMAAFIGALSWLGVTFFLGMVVAMYASVHIYRAGMRVSRFFMELDW